MFTKKNVWNTQAHTPTTSNRVKVTDIRARMISVDTYGFYNLHDRTRWDRPFQRLLCPGTAITGLRDLISKNLN